MGIRSQALETMLNYRRKSTLSSLITQKAVSHFHLLPKARPPNASQTNRRFFSDFSHFYTHIKHARQKPGIFHSPARMHKCKNRTRVEMKGESVFAADIGTQKLRDNVVCESRSPWVLSPPLSLQLLSFTKGNRVVVISPTITSIIYDNETKRCALHIVVDKRQLVIRVFIQGNEEPWQRFKMAFFYSGFYCSGVD